MFEPKDMARLQTREERAQDNFKKDSTRQLFLNSFGSRRKPHNSSKNEAYFHITTLL